MIASDQSGMNPVAREHFRTIVAEAVRKSGYDGYAAGRESDPHDAAYEVLEQLPLAHFEYRINDAGVRLRRVVAEGLWEVCFDVPAPSRRRPS